MNSTTPEWIIKIARKLAVIEWIDGYLFSLEDLEEIANSKYSDDEVEAIYHLMFGLRNCREQEFIAYRDSCEEAMNFLRSNFPEGKISKKAISSLDCDFPWDILEFLAEIINQERSEGGKKNNLLAFAKNQKNRD